MKKKVVFFLFVLILNSSLFADFVSLGSFCDQDGIKVDLFKLTETSIKDATPDLIKASRIYYEKYKKEPCSDSFYQQIKTLLNNIPEVIVIAAYKNNVCVGWILFKLYQEDKVLYLEDIRVWFSFLYAPYLILSIFKSFSFLDFKIYLNCDKNNLRVQELYKALGFNLSSTYNFNRYQIMEYNLNLDVQNMALEINDLWYQLLNIEYYLNTRFQYPCNKEYVGLFVNLNNAQEKLKKVMLYYKSRLSIILELVDYSSHDYLQNFIALIDNLSVRLVAIKFKI